MHLQEKDRGQRIQRETLLRSRRSLTDRALVCILSHKQLNPVHMHHKTIVMQRNVKKERKLKERRRQNFVLISESSHLQKFSKASEMDLEDSISNSKL